MTRYIGSTDIAAIAALYNPKLALDLPKNKTASDVYARLRWGLKAPMRKQMQRGLDMEQYALDYYAEHVGPWWRKLPLGEFWTCVDPATPLFTASPDAFDAPDGETVIEIKTQSEWARSQWGTPGTDEMSTRYLYQCEWLMARCEMMRTHVLCLFGHDVGLEAGSVEFIVTEPAIYVVERDNELIAQLDAYGERFLNEFVLPGIPPPVKSAQNRRAMKEMLKNDHGADAVERWEARVTEHAAANGTDLFGRPSGPARNGSGEGSGEDGVGLEG